MESVRSCESVGCIGREFSITYRVKRERTRSGAAQSESLQLYVGKMTLFMEKLKGSRRSGIESP
jgi:hypothetical protein